MCPFGQCDAADVHPTTGRRVEAPTIADLERCRQLQESHGDLELGVVDATVIALVERLGEEKVATLDHRHFGTVRPAHTAALSIVP